ncbi:hypothetical protein D3C85_1784920 [compost metagenome]
MRYIDRPNPKSVEESQQVIQSINDNFNKGANLIWAITLKSNPELMIGWDFGEQTSPITELRLVTFFSLIIGEKAYSLRH